MAHLSRTTSPAPIRHVHLGLGSFFRAHQAWYTHHAPDAGEWGIAAFTGRSGPLAASLTAQDGLYTLRTRTPEGDRLEVVTSLAAAHAASEHERWLEYLERPEVAVITTTVTEAGYARGADGGLDLQAPGVRADLAALVADPRARVGTVPGRLVAGLAARRRAGAGPVTILPCDNLPENARAVARVVAELATLVDPELARWVRHEVGYVATMVDRITPSQGLQDAEEVQREHGLADRAPVLTEPFSEWVLSGEFRAGRPRWEEAGATFAADVGPFEQRKLTLLNGGHSLLAYAGPLRGHVTVDQAVADPVCRGWLEGWWDEAGAHLALPAGELATYRASLLARFANPRMGHRLEQIAADGSQKLPVRVLPTLELERGAGRVPAGSVRVLAAWVLHLRGESTPVRDPGSDAVARAAGPLTEAVPRVLDLLRPGLGRDVDLVAAVRSHAAEPARA